jgi:hypothetical protein
LGVVNLFNYKAKATIFPGALQTAGMWQKRGCRRGEGFNRPGQLSLRPSGPEKVHKMSHGQVNFPLVSYPGKAFINLYRFIGPVKNK